MRKVLALFIALTMVLALAPCAYADPSTLSEGLIAHYDFSTDGAQPEVVHDVSGSGNDATVLAEDDRALTIDNGIAHFPGMNGYNVYGAALLLPESFNKDITNYTVSMWVKADSTYRYADQLARFWDFGNRESGVKNSIFARYTPSSGQFRLQDRGTGDSSDTSAIDRTYSDKPFTDKWGLLTVTFEKVGDNAYYTPHVYINGTEDTTFSTATFYTRSLCDLGELDDDTNGMFIGRTQWYDQAVMEYNPDFCGYMADIRIYSRAIAASEVTELYETTHPMANIEKKVVSTAAVSVSTKEGEAPILPGKVKVTFNTDETEDVAVTWEAIEPSQYAAEGSFTVNGMIDAYSYAVEATVRVKSAAEQTIDEGMVLHYTFDTDAAEPTKIIDSSGNGNDGEVLNTSRTIGGWGGWGGQGGESTTYNQKLKIENGTAKFAGSLSVPEAFWTTYVDGCAIKLPYSANEGIEDFTMSMWVKADSSYTFAGNMQRFFDLGNKADGSYDSIFFRYTASSGEMRLQDRVPSDSNRYLQHTVATKPFTDKWGLITVTFEKMGSDAFYTPTVYINGVADTAFGTSSRFVRSLKDLGTLTSDTANMLIGRTQWQKESDPDFCGYMDDIRLYDRALDGESVMQLYTATHPEKPTTIAIESVLENGTKIAPDRTVSARENDDYTYDYDTDPLFSENISYNDTNYTFAPTKSTLSIKVASTGNVVKLVYVMRAVESVSGTSVTTLVKDAPVLPSKVTLTYTTGESEEYAAIWDAVDAEKYASKGTFEVNGTLSGIDYAVKAQVTVYGISKIEGYKENDVNLLDMYPDLPEAVGITFENGAYTVAAVDWESVPEASYTTDKTVYTVRGTLAKYGDVIQTQFTTVAIESIPTVRIDTPLGEEAVFPDTVDAVGSDGNTYTMAVTWQDYDKTLLDDEGGFNVAGTVSYKNMTVNAQVRVVLSAEYDLTAIADTYTQQSGGSRNNYGGESELIISGTDAPAAAARIRYGFFMFDTSALGGSGVSGAKLKLYVNRIENTGANPTFSIYSVPATWDEYDITWRKQADWTDNMTLICQSEVLQTTTNAYVEFDVSDFFAQSTADKTAFVVTMNTCAGYVASRDTANAPKLAIECEGVKVDVAAYTENNELMFETYGKAVKGNAYTYPDAKDVCTYGGKLYVLDKEASVISFETVTDTSAVVLRYKEAASVEAEAVEAVTYTNRAPELPDTVEVTCDGVKTDMDVAWDAIDAASYEQKGSFGVGGTINGTHLSVSATVKVFEPLYDGEQIIGIKGDLTIFYRADGGEAFDSESVNMLYGSEFTLDESYVNRFEYLEVAAISGALDAIGQTLMLTELGQEIYIDYHKIDGVKTTFGAYILNSDDDYTNLEVFADATAINGTESDVDAALVIALYGADGSLEDIRIEKAKLESGMKSSAKFSQSTPFNMTEGRSAKVMLLNLSDLSILSDTLTSATMEIKKSGIVELTPTYDEVVGNIEKAQTFWQGNNNASSSNAFWHPAAYHTGNMEAYFLLGNPDYKKYSEDWASANGYKGVVNSNNPSTWTYGYDENRTGSAVLFGDWQICFQTYLDLAAVNADENAAARAKEVMGYQVTTDVDAYWWWADSLYMVMPVMTKMYLATDDEIYLKKLYEYFRYAKEFMYDGEGGIPTSKDGYTTSAYLKSGAQYADASDYKNLFYRDSNYVYPLNAISGQKNFWARGNGWVFAGLAKVLSDMPTDSPYRDEFMTTYLEMAQAIRDCQKVDADGNGFWTQSMLIHDYSVSSSNPEGYETSGTAFFCYGLMWGINNGVLDKNAYLECALRAHRYLTKVALADSGKVGYVQQIGSAAGSAASQSTTQNFGVGAYLLALCETARYVGGQEANEEYTLRKMQTAVAFTIGGTKYYANGKVLEDKDAAISEDGVIYLPLGDIADMLGYTVTPDEIGMLVEDSVNNKTLILQTNSSDIKTVNEITYVKASALMNTFGKYLEGDGTLYVLSHHKDFFNPTENEIITYITGLLQ